MAVNIGREHFMVIDKQGRKNKGCGRFLVSVGLGQPEARTRELTGKESIGFLAAAGGKLI